MTADAHKAAIAATYDAAADTFDRTDHWWATGRTTVERLDLRPGMHVLDVACGTGSSAIPAARAVAPGGHVLAVDLSERMLDVARRNAAAAGVADLIDWRRGDIDSLDYGTARFDAVICVFGIFFVADMHHAASELWTRVAPGGVLAVTSWGERVLQPAGQVFWDAVEAEQPELVNKASPWHAIRTPGRLAALLTSTGATDVHVELAQTWEPVDTDAWWDRVMGSGFRATIEQLDPAARERVRARCAEKIAAAHIDRVEMNVLYATARRPDLA